MNPQVKLHYHLSGSLFTLHGTADIINDRIRFFSGQERENRRQRGAGVWIMNLMRDF